MKIDGRLGRWLMVGLCWLATSRLGSAQTEFHLKDVCRLKGQEENVLHGVGFVVGLKGTGDSGLKPSSRGLARMIQLMGGQVATDLQGQLIEKELEQTKNVAMVFVQATVPAAGAQAGEKLSCTISAISAKSLEGGNLMLTPLLGPRADQPQVFALAQGPITLDNLRVPTTGRIVGGCKVETPITTNFVANDTVTLVLEPGHSSFSMAQQIEDLINNFATSGLGGNQPRSGYAASMSPPPSIADDGVAVAVDQTHIMVRIPEIYRERPVQFVAEILNLPLVVGKNNRRVVIREREGVIVIGEEVTIAPVAISHKNLTISTRAAVSNGFVGVGSNPQTPANGSTSLNELVKALNVLAVPTEDMIAIVKAIERQGNLYGELIIE
jgi:flagellar P-ring protein precursor FlgI